MHAFLAAVCPEREAWLAQLAPLFPRLLPAERSLHMGKVVSVPGCVSGGEWLTRRSKDAASPPGRAGLRGTGGETHRMLSVNVQLRLINPTGLPQPLAPRL